jgi:hypothetical protein
VLLLTLDSTALADPQWNLIAQEKGITVLERETPGRGFPTFRGTGTVDANLYHVLAVLSDFTRHTEWMHACKTSRVIKKVSEKLRIIYMRIDSPWPISDRDAVYHTESVLDRRNLSVNIEFKAIKSKLKGRVSGVVRMDNLKGHWKLKALSPTKTWVDYQVDADPGGWLPKWLAKLASRRLPLYTIRSLRKQVKKTLGWYARRIKRWKSGD